MTHVLFAAGWALVALVVFAVLTGMAAVVGGHLRDRNQR